MARLCKDCGLNLDKYSEPKTDRHRCVGGKIVRKPTQLEAERIAKGELDPAALVSMPAASAQPVGRLAPRGLVDGRLSRTTPATQPTLVDVMAAIDQLTAHFVELKAALLVKASPRTDA